MNKKLANMMLLIVLVFLILPDASSLKVNNEYNQQNNQNPCDCDSSFSYMEAIYEGKEFSSPKPVIIETPDYFSWKDFEGEDWTTPAKDQGNCGSCWDYAAIGALESIINIREGSAGLNPDLSEQYVLSCLSRAGSCRGGLARLAYKYINLTTDRGNYCNGVVLESCLSYYADDDIPCDDKCPDWEDKLIPILDFGYWYPDGSSEDIEAIKSQILLHGPVVTTMLFTFYEHGENNLEEWGWTHHDPEDYYPYPGAFSSANHQVVIVGWKDEVSVGNGGYWIVKNSCSSEWGYNGFFNIEYGSLNIDSIEIDWVDYDPNSYNHWSPTVNAGGIYYASVGEEINFDATKTVDPEDDIVDFSWDFGEGTTKTGITPTHVYSEKGIYEITLAVTDSLGNIGYDNTWAFIDESNNAPNKPTLRGRRIGIKDNEYEYTFFATDPDGDDVYYYLNWGDTYWEGWWEPWIGPYKSGEKVKIKNTWDENGNYIVRVKAKDKYDFKSDWATLEVSMPKNKIINPFERFLENHPYMLPMLKQLLGQ